MADFGLPISTDARLSRDPGPALNIRMGEICAASVSAGLNPFHLFKAAQLHWNSPATQTDSVDTHLALFNKILPSDFLHYGYFEELNTSPEDMKLSDIDRAGAICRVAPRPD